MTIAGQEIQLVKLLEDIIALLEGGTKGFAFASGIAAISLHSSSFHKVITYSFQKTYTEGLIE